MRRDWLWRPIIIALILFGALTSGISPVHADTTPRFFPQTGFSIDNDTIWDYFNHRGGVTTFGYPTSRAFQFEGLTVQFFQRRIIQLDQSGFPRNLNILDARLMPYTSFNGAAFPSIDGQLLGAAPTSADQAATLAFVKAYAPDNFEGVQVNFFQTFTNTVSLAVAFPNGGSAGLLPGFNLEMWGVPTSLPAFDPNNHNFVYLRFQRGIMMYDFGCNCTQAVLLADYLKSILTGQNLPSDLSAEAQGSPLIGQFPPSSGVFTPPGSVPPPIAAPTPTAIPTPYPVCNPLQSATVTLTWPQTAAFVVVYLDPSRMIRFWINNDTNPQSPPTLWRDDSRERNVGGPVPVGGIQITFTPTWADNYTFRIRGQAEYGPNVYAISYVICPAGTGP